jgi:type IV secretory pathway VirB9-like protein
MPRPLLALLAGTVLAWPALAVLAAPASSPAQAPPPDPAVSNDPTVRVIPYDPLHVETLIGTLGMQTSITVSPKEHITRLTFGDQADNSDSQVFEGPDPDQLKQGLKSNVSLWPHKAGRTNLVMLTEDEKGIEHPYRLVLVVRDPAGEKLASNDKPATDAVPPPPLPTYGLVYSYPEQERAERTEQARQRWVQRRAVAAVRLVKAQAAAAAAQLDRAQAAPCDVGKGNPRYVGQGDRNLAPLSQDGRLQVCDDGQATYFRYPGNTAPPSVFVPTPDGKHEEFVAKHMRGDWLVAERIAPEFHLRDGQAVLYVWNKGYDPIGTKPATGTVSPDVERIVRQAAGP